MREAWEFIKYVNSANPGARTRDELQRRGAARLPAAEELAAAGVEPLLRSTTCIPNIAMMRGSPPAPTPSAAPDLGIWQEYYREVISSFDRVRLLDAPPEEALGLSQKRIE
jgi:hypothetical protein